MPSNNQRKKRNYFIKHEFQGRLSWHFFLLTLLCLLCFYLFFSLFSANRMSIVYDGQQLQVQSMSTVLFQELLANNWIILLVIGAIVVFATIIVSHRIAGPIHHFEQVIERMCTGRFDQKIVLRKRDNGKDLAAAINRLNQSLATDIHRLRGLSKEMSAALERGDVKQIAAANQQLRELLACYQVHEGQDKSGPLP